MSTVDKLMHRAEKRNIDADKKEEVAYVRAEKKADEEAAKRLAELYGDGRRIHMDRGRRTRGWKCFECGHMNFDIRNVCGECLARDPRVRTTEKADIKFAPRSTDQNIHLLHLAGGRAFRTYRATEPAPRHATAERGGCGAYTRAPNACDDGSAPVCGDGDTYDDGEDEPPCGGGGAGAAVSGGDGGRKAEDDSDSDDGGAKIVYEAATKEYVLRLHVPPRYFKFLIGTKGATLQETQRLTGATVSIPRLPDEEPRRNAGVAPTTTDEDQPIVIRASQPGPVRAAHIRIAATMSSCKDLVGYSHFLSIPLGTPGSFHGAIHDMMTASCDEGKNIDASIFQRPSRVHFTLLMLRLFTPEDLARARQLLLTIEPWIRTTFRAADRITCKGLCIFHDDPSEVHVAFLQPVRDECFNKLVTLIDRINKTFIEAGLASEKDVAHNEKLHATIVNSKWRTTAPASVGGRLAFDATDMLRIFGNTPFGSHALRRLDLSILGRGEGVDGYYPSDFAIEFPK